MWLAASYCTTTLITATLIEWSVCTAADHHWQWQAIPIVAASHGSGRAYRTAPHQQPLPWVRAPSGVIPFQPLSGNSGHLEFRLSILPRGVAVSIPPRGVAARAWLNASLAFRGCQCNWSCSSSPPLRAQEATPLQACSWCGGAHELVQRWQLQADASLPVQAIALRAVSTPAPQQRPSPGLRVGQLQGNCLTFTRDLLWGVHSGLLQPSSARILGCTAQMRAFTGHFGRLVHGPLGLAWLGRFTLPNVGSV